MLRVTVPQPGVVLGSRYRLVQHLGRGGMAEVWRGFDERMQRPVAIKIFNDAGVIYHLCGLGQSCAIDSGKPSALR